MPTDALVFVDTNVFLYADDNAYPDKQNAAQAWLTQLWRMRTGRLSAQVINEYYINVTAKLSVPLPLDKAREKVARLKHWLPQALDISLTEKAWGLQDKYNLSYWDALIVASALRQGCDYLLSEDMQHQQKIEEVQIINPFLCAPESI